MGLWVPAGQGTHTHTERKKRKRRRLQQCYTLCPGDASAWLEETRVEIQVCPALGVRLCLCWARFGKSLCFGEAFRQLEYSRKPWEQGEPCLCFLLLPAGALPCLLCVSSGHSSPPAPLCASCATALGLPGVCSSSFLPGCLWGSPGPLYRQEPGWGRELGTGLGVGTGSLLGLGVLCTAQHPPLRDWLLFPVLGVLLSVHSGSHFKLLDYKKPGHCELSMSGRPKHPAGMSESHVSQNC